MKRKKTQCRLSLNITNRELKRESQCSMLKNSTLYYMKDSHKTFEQSVSLRLFQFIMNSAGRKFECLIQAKPQRLGLNK